MTALQVINRALVRLGEQPATTDSDTSPKAAYRACTEYPISRDQVLRLVAWPSCTTRQAMKGMHEQATPWTAITTYGLGQRVTNDTYKVYECITEGKSATSGGPTGTGSAITDGTIVWKYVELSTVDSAGPPVTVRNNWAHAGTQAAAAIAYVVDDLVSWATGKVYACITAGNTGTGPATPPTTTAADITDGTVHWRYYGTPPINRTAYAYQYVLPADCLRIIKVPNLNSSDENDQGARYHYEGISIYTDVDDAYLKYVKLETDPTNWDRLLQEAVVLKLAADICFDVTGDSKKANNLYQEFASIYQTARVVAMNEGAEGPVESTRWEDI